MHFDLHRFLFSPLVFHFKSFRCLFMFRPHSRQPQMCSILELRGSLNAIIQSKAKWIWELPTNMKWKKYFRGKPVMTFFTLRIYSEMSQVAWSLYPVLWTWTCSPAGLSSWIVSIDLCSIKGDENHVGLSPLPTKHNYSDRQGGMSTIPTKRSTGRNSFTVLLVCLRYFQILKGRCYKTPCLMVDTHFHNMHLVIKEVSSPEPQHGKFTWGYTG